MALTLNSTKRRIGVCFGTMGALLLLGVSVPLPDSPLPGRWTFRTR